MIWGTKLTKEQLKQLLVFLGIDEKEVKYYQEHNRGIEGPGKFSTQFKHAKYKVNSNSEMIEFEIEIKWSHYHIIDGTHDADYTRNPFNGREERSNKDLNNNYSQTIKRVFEFKKAVLANTS